MAAALLVWLLIAPDIKTSKQTEEKAIIAIAIDNSASIKKHASKYNLTKQIDATIQKFQKLNYEVKLYNLTDKFQFSALDSLKFEAPKSNLSEMLAMVENDNVEQNLKSILLFSDGIVNDGQSLAYQTFKVPIFSIGLGDTVQKNDISISTIYYNKTVNKNAKFPIKITVNKSGFKNLKTFLIAKKDGKIVQQMAVDFSENQKQKDLFLNSESAMEDYISYNFELKAVENEITLVNNFRNIYVETIQSKKNILIHAHAPHPDLKILNEQLSQNKEFEVFNYIQGFGNLPTEKMDVVILHQIPAENTDYSAVLAEYKKLNLPCWYFLGNQSSMAQCNVKIPSFKILSNGQIDKVQPEFASDFDKFILPENITSRLADFAPVQVPFGAYNLPGWSVVLYQSVGNISTEKPLWAINTNNPDNYMAITIADGLWQWSMLEKSLYQDATLLQNLIQKTVQLLLSSKDKKKFKFAPIQQNFDVTETISFESEAKNDIGEWITGNQIDIIISNKLGNKNSFSCQNTNNAVVFETAGFAEGMYTFVAKSIINKKEEVAKGTFVVSKTDIESINQTADYQLLREVSEKNNGNFYPFYQLNKIFENNFFEKATSKLLSEDSYLPPIHQTWIIVLLLCLLFVEWAGRKFFGSL